MSKKISIGARPTTRQADAWVNAPAPTAAPPAALVEDMNRLTIDIPASLHRRVKSACAAEGMKMAELVRELLSSKYGNP